MGFHFPIPTILKVQRVHTATGGGRWWFHFEYVSYNYGW